MVNIRKYEQPEPELKQEYLCEPELMRLLQSGSVSEYVRASFEEKQAKLGVSSRDLADFFGVTMPTIRKWRSGETRHCSMSVRKKMIGFIKGDFDEMLRNCHRFRGPDLSHTIRPVFPDGLLKSMEMVARINDMLSFEPEISQAFLATMNSGLLKITMEMTHGRNAGR